ncbi:RadP cytochrome P450 epoxidase [Rhizodiscina lignyota]|uniref:RadP cytochrome P450 epoxidase n=1 Tax=Rhizodiscina lignyota TaxID=1504668 RepID=A0A9P4I7T1_9PEZI|nr:RadP cytochrome P450 epoxidase [Rhizodiscina lignyota]
MAGSHVLQLTAVAAVVGTISYVLYTIIYNLYFHPLARYPGPKLYAVWRIPLILDRISGNSVRTIHAMHKKYGENVRVSPNEISTISPAAWKDVYGYRRNGHGGFDKDTIRFYRRDPIGNGATAMISEDDNNHARQRRIFTHAFSDRALREQEPLLKHYTNLLVEKLKDASADGSRKVDIVSFYNFTTFDTMADLTFGEPLHLLDNMDYNPWVRNIFAGIKYVAVADAFRGYPVLHQIQRARAPKDLKEKREYHLKFCHSRVDRRLEKEETDHPDFWSLVLKAEGAKGLTRPEMHVNSQLLMTAGTETTATLLSGLTYYLCQNPDKMKKLVDEIRGSFSHPDEMTTVTLPRLEYLHACLEEGLRIYPPVAVGLPRIVPPEGGDIDGHPLPGGATIYFTHYPAYHSEKNFALPDEFHPERFLQGEDPRFANDKMDAFNPFSNGPRNCLGKNLAYHEMRLILAKVLYSFDIELLPQSQNWTNHKVYTLWEKPPLYVKLRPLQQKA